MRYRVMSLLTFTLLLLSGCSTLAAMNNWNEDAMVIGAIETRRVASLHFVLRQPARRVLTPRP